MKRTFIYGLTLLALLWQAFVAAGQEKIYSQVIPDATGAFIPGAQRQTIDPIYNDPVLRAQAGPVRRMSNVVMLRINEESSFFIPGDFTVDVAVTITKRPVSGGADVPVNKVLHLDYRVGKAKKSDAAVYYLDENDAGYQLTAAITNITSNVTWDVKQLLQLKIEIHSEYDAPFHPEVQVSGLTHIAPTTIPFDEFEVTWNYPMSGSSTLNNNPSEYDLEWAWIEESAADSYKNSSGQWDPALIFSGNATRVTVPVQNSSYKIPLFYDGTGWIFYRVRPLQRKLDGQVINGEWAFGTTEGNGMYHITAGHEDGLNWQVSTIFAEDGKRKTVIQYFDGTLRGRQTVTKDNSQANPTTVVAETYFDYQGRPTIQVLPAPTLSQVIAFTRNFNNNNIDHNGYPKEIYDALTTGQPICGNGAPALDKSTVPSGANGAGNYYSSQNPLAGTGVHKFIPEANGFAFAETRYTRDATGRTAAQGGVGEAFRIGSGHETQFYYSSASQEELDMLFGTDAGVASHYQKTVVRDANGQYSVSYTDMYGRTVATALAGEAPASMEKLPSLQSLISTALPAVKKQLLDNETNLVSGRSITMVKDLVVTSPGIRHFEYKLDPKQLVLQNCQQQNICYDCLYDLSIEIFDPCSNTVVHTETRSNFSLPHPNVCGTDPADIDFSFDVLLNEGVYTITKKLTVSKDAQDAFLAQAMTYGNLVCKDFKSIQLEIATIMNAQNQNCQPTCQSCTEKLAGGLTAFRSKFMLAAGLTEAQMTMEYERAITAAYDQAKADCDAICESGSDRVNNYRAILLMDMMPDQGQYARLRMTTSIDGTVYNPPVDLTVKTQNIFNGGKYKLPKTETGGDDYYRDEIGIVDPEASGNLSNWTPDQFTEHFKESWANQLLYYHPEFRKLKLVESASMKAAYHWQEQFQEKDKWADVSSIVSGSPGLVQTDPLFILVTPGSAAAMLAKMNACVPVKLSSGATYMAGMWQFAVAAVKCRLEPVAQQVSCLQSCSNTPGTFPTEISCDADKNKVWQIFSTLYFREREIIIYNYLQTNAPVDASIFAQDPNPAIPRFQERFVNPGSIEAHVPADLLALYQEINNPNPHGSTQLNSALEAQYESNCRSYAENWLNQLKVFDICKGSAISPASYNGLIEQLVTICKRGSDLTHPLGSSSTAPGSPATSPATFEEALSAFMNANSIPLTETCHPFIITWPKPYDRSPVLVNDEVDETTPDACVCERLTQLHTLHTTAVNNGTFAGDFLSYLQTVHGTAISSSQLAQLEGLCNPTTAPTCKFLDQPIVLPPVLQCNASNNTCISCSEYNILKNEFISIFGSAIPAGLSLPKMFPSNETEERWNKAFADFMNYRTGFSKQWHEYANFDKGCVYNGDPGGGQTGICTRIANYISTFNTIWPTLQDGETNCQNLFARYFNTQEGTAFSYDQIKYLYMRCPQQGCKELPINCTNSFNNPDTIVNATPTPCGTPFPTHLCGLNDPVQWQVDWDPDDPCKDIDQLIWNATVETLTRYLEKVKNDFIKAYLDKCLAVQQLESFTVQSPSEKEYHYTLYYYDQSGALVQTVPPAGVDNFNNNASTRDAFLASVKAARANPAAAAVRPVHVLQTTYRYNTLGQVVEQQSPDGGLSQFWYDELGRLVVSQNARQRAGKSYGGTVTKQYSYTLYDELGRITQVGQKPTNATMDQAVSRSKTALANFLNNTGIAKEQITRTVYDIAYAEATVTLPIVQRNLRNRVSFSQVVSTEPSNPSDEASWAGAQSSASFYTYDIHGNVDELVQDFNEGPMREVNNGANRFKKLAYTYDLISGKVNTVSYQPDYLSVGGSWLHHPDRFYHRYEYDAENKLVTAETSHDGIIWETDARYTYYKHGPLARTELGQQRVQGVDYAYTLQGWLKGVNSTAISAAPIEDCAPGTGRDVLDIFNRQQYNHPQNYVARKEINMFPEFTSDTPDDFETTLNINLAPCVPVITNTPYITGDMGEDGKPGTGTHAVVARDAYSFSLNYYQASIGGTTVNDYQAAGTAQPFTNAGMFSLTNIESGGPGQVVAKPLFNGNIASMFVNIPVLAPGGSGSASAALLYGYRYDQLNRIVSMDAFNGFNATANGWYNGVATATEQYQERISYDANGNILKYFRNGSTASGATGSAGGPQQMDDLFYQYPRYANTPANIANRTAGKLINNRLRFVHDKVDPGNYSEDIESQTSLDRDFLEMNPASWQPETPGNDNYVYDEIGNLVKDGSEGINEIEWNVYGKIALINKGGITIAYQYDAGGNRIAKIVRPDRGIGTYTFYVRDASGNVMAVYEKNPPLPGEAGDLKQTEIHLYGSSRLGIYRLSRNMEHPFENTMGIFTFERGNKFFELSNHLGNVLVVVSDRKLQVQIPPVGGSGGIAYYAADIITATDYYPFGMDMVGRRYGEADRYGFNGKERDRDINSLTAYDYGFRIYNPAIGKFLSVDPIGKEYPWYTPYQFAGNIPIWFVDVDGKEPDLPLNPFDYLVQPFIQTKYQRDVIQGFYERGKGVIMGIVHLFDGSNKKDGPSQGYIDQGIFGTPNTMTFRACVALFGMMEAILMDYANLLQKTFEGDGKAAGALLFEAFTFFAPEGKGISALKEVEAIQALDLAADAMKNGMRDFKVMEEALIPMANAIPEESRVLFRATTEYEKPFELKPYEIKAYVDKETGFMKDKGVSINSDKLHSTVQKHGGAWEIQLETIPKELKIKHTPSHGNPGHYEIVPVKPSTMTLQQYQRLIEQIKVLPFNKI